MPAAVGHWYFHVEPVLTAEGLRAEIGSYDAARRFKAVLQRDLERSLPYEAAAATANRGTQADERFAALVDRAGGPVHTGARGWSSDLSSR